MKKQFTLFLTLLSLMMAGCSGVSSPRKNGGYKNAVDINGWSHRCGSSIGTSVGTTGAQFENLAAWGDNWYTNSLYSLNGLEFDLVWTNCTDMQQAFGFFFSTSTNAYINQNTNLIFHYQYPYAGQSRLFIASDHFHLNDGTTGKLNYTSPNTSSGKGFGYQDGTLIMNAPSSHSVHYTFALEGDFYKVTIKDTNIWFGYHTNENSTDKTIVTYVHKSSFNLNTEGQSRLQVYGWLGSGGSVAPTVQINNIKVDNNFTVSFDSNGGSAVPSQSIEYNGVVTKPASPTKSGAIFKDWYTDPECTKLYDFNKAVTSSFILYAGWGEAVTNSYDADDIPVISSISGMTPSGYDANTEILNDTLEVSGYTGKVLKLTKVGVNGPGITLDFSNKSIGIKEVYAIKFRFYTSSGTEMRITTNAGSKWAVRYNISTLHDQWNEISIYKDGTNFYTPDGQTMNSFKNEEDELAKFAYCFRSSSVVYIDNIDVITYKKTDYDPPVFIDVPDNINAVEGSKPDFNFVAIDAISGAITPKYIYSDGCLVNGLFASGNHTLTLVARDDAYNKATKVININVSVFTNDISHPVTIGNQDGCLISCLTSSSLPNKTISFTVNNIESTSGLTIEVVKGKGGTISYSGNNPYSFIMPDDSVTINVSNSSASEGYISPENLSIFNEDYVHYDGRHMPKQNGMLLKYSATSFLLEVNVSSSSNSITANFTSGVSVGSGETDQYGQAYVDTSSYGNKITIPSGTNNVTIASNLPTGKHVYRFVKLNESNSSTLILNSLSFSSGIKIKKHVETRKLIEFYGDSITCAYGNMASSSSEHYRMDTQDASKGYAFMTADALGYRCSSVSFSGIGVACSQGGWGSYVMSDKYATLDDENYFMKQDKRDIVVMNLGTNDHAMYVYGGYSEEIKAQLLVNIKTNFKAICSRILNLNRNTKIIYCYNMMVTLNSNILNQFLSAINELNSEFNTTIYTKEFTPNTAGADGHPGAAAHATFANELASFIQNTVLK